MNIMCYLPTSPLHAEYSGIFPVVPEDVASGSGDTGPFSVKKTDKPDKKKTSDVTSIHSLLNTTYIDYNTTMFIKRLHKIVMIQ